MWTFKGSKKLMEKFKEVVYRYFISHFRKHTRMYQIHSGNETKDLRIFMMECMEGKRVNKLADELRKKYSDDWLLEFGAEDPLDYDRMVVDILREVHNLITYKSDQKVWAVPEYWQTPKETLSKLTGDCEDGAILIVTLARLSGVPASRIFLSAGYVEYGRSTVGHAYVTYLGSDAAEYILDWCYFYDSRRIPTRKRNWYDKRYLDRWFFGNDSGFYKK